MRDNKLDVLQSNVITEAAYTLNLQQKRVIMLGIYNANKNGVAKVQVAQFTDFFGVRKNHAKAFILKERETLIAANVTLHNDSGIDIVNWLERLSYNTKDDFITLTFTPTITAEITALQRQFTRYSILEVGRIKNVYVIRLYMLLCQWRSTGAYKIKLPSLKTMLQTDGKHDVYNNFKSRVLNVAVKEINGKTNFTMRYEEIKAGRKVVELQFYFYEKIPDLT